ncbi:MAG: hypothetical protein JNM93_04720 [Bacteriovoracaceae bacterium]|nr:hypothetical protein [Bacteriovoracaceae bacterium]
MQIISFQHAFDRWQAQQLTDAEMAVIAFLLMGHATKGERFAQKKLLENILTKEIHLMQILETAAFRGVKSKVRTMLTNWLKGTWELKLITYIPKPIDVLIAQTQNTRYVTMMSQPQYWASPVLTKENAFHFLCHDLEHGYQFWNDFHTEQVGFNRELLTIYQQGELKVLESEPFKARLHYLLSDMNTHPQHSLQFLEALWTDYFQACGLRGIELNTQIEFKMRSFLSYNKANLALSHNKEVIHEAFM